MNPAQTRFVWQQWLIGAVLFGSGVLWGSGIVQLNPSARADVRDLAPTTNFLAGSERSEIVLKEIEALYKRDIIPTLKNIDSGVEQVEARLTEIAQRGERRRPPQENK